MTLQGKASHKDLLALQWEYRLLKFPAAPSPRPIPPCLVQARNSPPGSGRSGCTIATVPWMRIKPFWTSPSHPLHMTAVLKPMTYGKSPDEVTFRCLCVFHCVQLFATSWIVPHQAPLSMEFSRQDYWSGLPFTTPGIFPTQGSNLSLLCWHVDSFTTEPPGKP